MSSLISGILVIAAFLVSSVLIFGTFLTTSVTQSQSLKELAKINQEKLRSELSITSASVTSAVSASGTEMTLVVDNTGSQSGVSFDQMDVIIEYTDSSDNLVRTYLSYNAAGAGDNQWTSGATGSTPDSFNPNLWDPDESFALDLRVVPELKGGSSALVVVGTPQGVNDQTTLTND
ncbi:MAG: hypothetical protein ACE5Q6_09720 [Dehalococcoidia bacterium]